MAENMYWMVHRKNGGVPNKKHNNEQSAREEAIRLAEANPGEVFFVLFAFVAYSAPAPVARRMAVTVLDPDPDIL